MTQLNTPYPATAYLSGFLLEHGYDVSQRDPAIELVHRLFSKSALLDMKSIIESNYEGISKSSRPEVINFFLSNSDRYLNTCEAALRYLRGLDMSLSLRISTRNFLPEGPAFSVIDELSSIKENGLGWAFGSLGVHDKAKFLCSLFLDDLASVIKNGVDPHFELSRYAERLASSNPVFDDLYEGIKENYTYVDEVLEEITEEYLLEIKPTVLGLTVPFPGNVYGAFKIAQKAKELLPDIKIIMGGGYVNTELRSLKDPRVFEFIDYITLDDGEKPILTVLEYINAKRSKQQLFRVFCVDGRNSQDTKTEDLQYIKTKAEHDIAHMNTGTPTYKGLDLSKYLSVFEMLNPMHRIWSDGRWNKLTLAHGCYWNKCSFCDITLDYIERYDEANVDVIIGRIKSLIAETNQTGFHFVDEAAPPKIMFSLAKRLIEEGLQITWWANIRFEMAFTEKRCKILADSGCIAVSGGLEIASNRLLKLMQKGVTVEQVARVTKAFSNSGVLVHAYLMYGFPSQTENETIDSLERVRQLFEANCIHSAYWHRFAATIHSPIGKNPDAYGVEIPPQSEVMFAENEISFHDPVGADHDMLGVGLRRALYNYMYGYGLDIPVETWFDAELNPPDVEKTYIKKILSGPAENRET